MGIKNALSFMADVGSAYVERDRKVSELASTLVNKTYGVDYDQAKKIAAVLIDQAELTWK